MELNKLQEVGSKKGRWLLIGSVVAVLGVVGVILWKKRAEKKEAERLKAEQEALAAEEAAKKLATESKPSVATKKDDSKPAPKVEASKKNQLEKIADNIGSSAVLYVDKVTATIDTPDKTKATAYFLLKNNAYFVISGGKIVKKGKWSNDGLQIILDNGRIVRTGSVLGNIRTSIGK